MRLTGGICSSYNLEKGAEVPQDGNPLIYAEIA
jgi:hypothetical protein